MASEYIVHLLEQLAPPGRVRARAMFSGHGIRDTLRPPLGRLAVVFIRAEATLQRKASRPAVARYAAMAAR